jgi:hypothetical protein
LGVHGEVEVDGADMGADVGSGDFAGGFVVDGASAWGVRRNKMSGKVARWAAAGSLGIKSGPRWPQAPKRQEPKMAPTKIAHFLNIKEL